jgi:hypothetical protein
MPFRRTGQNVAKTKCFTLLRKVLQANFCRVIGGIGLCLSSGDSFKREMF